FLPIMLNMKKQILVILVFVAIVATGSAQNYFTRDGKVKFDATAASSPEKIEGLSKTGSCVVDVATGKMQWAVLVKGIQFEKALMEEHFNENYMESSKYPKATFSGQITNLNEVNFGKDGTYNAVVTGKMTVHGVTKDMTANGALTVVGGTLKLNAGFSLLLSDYAVDIPSLVSDKIAKEAKILIDATLAPLK
ncbi:MAG: hypothetical protein RIQ78_296, partial [Bacteroidota bacterium]